MKLSVVTCTFLLLVLQYSETKVQSPTLCEWQVFDPCVCAYEDPNTGNIMRVDISRYFEYPFIPRTNSDKYTYTFSPCAEVPCEESTSSGVACQYIKSQGRSVSLGRIGISNTWSINQPSASKFQFTINYNGGDSSKEFPSRETEVTFMYADTNMTMEVTSEQGTIYNMLVTGRLIQPQLQSSGRGGGV